MRLKERDFLFFNCRCKDLLSRMRMVFMQAIIEKDANSLEIFEFNAIVTTIYKMIVAIPYDRFRVDR